MSNSGDAPSATPSFSLSGAQTLPTRRIHVLGVPLDMGASRRGVDMGPSAMRVAGLEARLEALGHQVTDGGNILVEIAETQAFGHVNARYLKQIAETCTRTAHAVVKILEEDMMPLVLGGDHSLAVGSVSGLSLIHISGQGGTLPPVAGASTRTPRTTAALADTTMVGPVPR